MKFNKLFAVLLATSLTASPFAMAQEATTPTTEEPIVEAPADDALSLGQEEAEAPRPPKVGERYVKELHGDWIIQCVKTEDGNDPCTMFQLLRDADNNPVAEVVMRPVNQGQAVAGANIVTPLETLLTAQLGVQVDNNKARRYPYAFCTQQGCIARIGLTAGDLASYKRGNIAKVAMVPAGSPDKPLTLAMSLKGFTAAFDSLKP